MLSPLLTAQRQWAVLRRNLFPRSRLDQLFSPPADTSLSMQLPIPDIPLTFPLTAGWRPVCYFQLNPAFFTFAPSSATGFRPWSHRFQASAGGRMSGKTRIPALIKDIAFIPFGRISFRMVGILPYATIRLPGFSTIARPSNSKSFFNQRNVNGFKPFVIFHINEDLFR